MTPLPEPTTIPEKPSIGVYKRHVMVCTGIRCDQHGDAQALVDTLSNKFKVAGLHAGPTRVKLSQISCIAVCRSGPLVCVQPDGAWYYNVTSENMDRIIAQHLVGDQVVDDLVFHQGPGTAAVPEIS